MNKVPLLVFVVMAIFFAALLLRHKDPSEITSALVGRPVPAFSVPLEFKSGERLTSHDLKGAPSVINVFASWCVSCRLEQGILEEIGHDEDVLVYGLNYKDKTEDLAAWLKKYGDPYDAIAADRDGRLAMDLGVYGVPETFIIDRDGVIRYKHVGVVTDEVYQSIFKPLLAELR